MSGGGTPFPTRETLLPTMTLYIDLETYSSVNLKTMGSYVYTASPDFEILIAGYAIGEGHLRLLLGEEHRDGDRVAEIGLAARSPLVGVHPAAVVVGGLDQRVEVTAHTCGRQAQLLADAARGDGSGLQHQPDDRAAGVTVLGMRRRLGRANDLRTEFHNTSVTQFPKRV